MGRVERALVWFRSDLRVGDNPALRAGCAAASEGVVAVFLIPADQWCEHDWGAAKVDFVLRNVGALSDALGRLNIALLVREAGRFGDAAEVLLRVALKYKCGAVYFNREYEVNERRRDQAVVGVFEDRGLGVHAFDDQAVLAPGRVLKRDGGPYTVFTPFKRRWYEVFEDDSDGRALGSVRGRAKMIGQPDPVPSALDGFPGYAHPADWPAGEAHARKRLARFIQDRVEGYQGARDTPSVEGTSGLSPYLSAGVVSAWRCVRAAMDVNDGMVDAGREGIVTWVGELIWRDFYRHVMVAFPRVSMGRAFQAHTEAVPWRRDEGGFRSWCEGRTGVPIVDAGMRQLLSTGWMHNRLRMVTAMFLTKDLLIDWRWGERHFMRDLVDGDLASNNGGWQWSASTGTDAAPYFRVFNPWTQGKRFDPDGGFIRRYVPELDGVPPGVLHDPSKLASHVREKGLAYPEPIVDHATARRRAIAAFRGLR